MLLQYKPKWFLAENVGGIQSANAGNAFKRIQRDMVNAGYKIYPHLYKFEEYGVPQARHDNYNELNSLVSKYNAELIAQRAELNKLGLFKRKEKQELQERIRQTQSNITSTQDKIAEL